MLFSERVEDFLVISCAGARPPLDLDMVVVSVGRGGTGSSGSGTLKG